MNQLQLFNPADFYKPVRLRKSKCPRIIPTSGAIDIALIGSAKHHIEEFFKNSPSDPAKSNALLYLEFAYQMAVTQEKLARSVHWISASYEVRLDLSYQLDSIRLQIRENLQKFMHWWNLYCDRMAAQGDTSHCFTPTYPEAPDPEEICQRHKEEGLQQRLGNLLLLSDRLKTKFVKEFK